MRTGLVAEKIGMTRLFDEQGEHVPVTVLHLESCQVLAHKTEALHGYNAVQIGFGKGREKSLNKAEKGLYAKHKVDVKKGLKEFRVGEDAFLEVGLTLHPDHFKVGQYVDVVGTSLGKGFAGVAWIHRTTSRPRKSFQRQENGWTSWRGKGNYSESPSCSFGF